jgi:hypothetical protein
MKSSKTLIACTVVLIALSVGFIAGWFCKSKSAEIIPPSDSALQTKQSALASIQKTSVEPIKRAMPAPGSSDALNANRAETIAWLKRRHSLFQMSAFMGDSFNVELAVVLGLNSAEIEQIDMAVQQVKKRLDELEVHAATGQVSADGKTLTVSIPSLTNEGGALYADLLNKFSQVMGPERFQLFNEITGDSFDRNFDRFDLNAVTYELALDPTNTIGNKTLYSFKRYTSDGADKSTSWSGGTLDRESLQKTYPALGHFFTPDLVK